MSSIAMPLLAAALVATGCQPQRDDRDKTKPGVTETTGATLDTRGARTDETARDAGVSTATTAKEEQKAKPPAKAPATAKKKTSSAHLSKSKEEPVTAAPIPTPTPPTPTPTAPVGRTSITSGPLPPAAQPNRSTTLGDSSSGMYTGGAGTYGGTATWGSAAKK